ncbi:MAG: hypothetical protein MJ108_09070 [Saccharofermentans sp.]|nr:hypothetical protein [Saccharofermentans sp.]
MQTIKTYTFITRNKTGIETISSKETYDGSRKALFYPEVLNGTWGVKRHDTGLFVGAYDRWDTAAIIASRKMGLTLGQAVRIWKKSLLPIYIKEKVENFYLKNAKVTKDLQAVRSVTA